MSEIHKFLMANGAVRIEAVQLTGAWQTMANMQAYPAPVQRLLGELVAASTLLAATLKFNGTLALQLQGDGAVRLAVVECRPAQLGPGWWVRATIKLAQDAEVPETINFKSLVNPYDSARFLVVLDPLDKQRGQQAYTGIVPLVGDTLADALAHYFATSEQLPTQLWLSANGSVAAGVLIQRMPHEGGNAAPHDADAWNRAQHLAGTIQSDELLTLAPTELVRRVFYEETVAMLGQQPVQFVCSCSREKVAGVLRMLGRAEIESILQEQDTVTVNCEYCAKTYRFDAVDAAAALRDVPGSAKSETLQ
jgi:molecular chaperone Hsp33